MELPGFDPGASTLLTLHSSDWATAPLSLYTMLCGHVKEKTHMLTTGIEPATVGLLDQCSTDWATRAYNNLFDILLTRLQFAHNLNLSARAELNIFQVCCRQTCANLHRIWYSQVTRINYLLTLSHSWIIEAVCFNYFILFTRTGIWARDLLRVKQASVE